MKEDDNSNGEEQFEFEPADSWPSGNKLFSDLDENEEFEEPDRDSDYASMYTEVEEEEPDYPGEDREDQLDIVEAAAELTPWEGQEEQSGNSWEEDNWEQDPAPSEPEPVEEPEQDTWTALSALRADEQDFEIQPADPDADDSWEEEAYEGEDEEREVTLPLGLIAVGILALVLLGAGGYGVMQDRTALQEEIRQLQSSMATAANPADVAKARANSETVASRNRELEAQLAELASENRSLQSIIGGLESQLRAQQEALAKPETPPPAPKPAPKKAVSKPETKKPASVPSVNVTTGTWFVNFGSYSQRPTAENWAGRLKPASGDVVVIAGEKDGRTFYRVRVINLTSKEVANNTARKLEEAYKLSRLWVGQSR